MTLHPADKKCAAPADYTSYSSFFLQPLHRVAGDPAVDGDEVNPLLSVLFYYGKNVIGGNLIIGFPPAGKLHHYLINGDSPHHYGGVLQYLLANGIEVSTSAQVHNRIYFGFYRCL